MLESVQQSNRVETGAVETIAAHPARRAGVSARLPFPTV
jgi:hypothetical protein